MASEAQAWPCFHVGCHSEPRRSGPEWQLHVEARPSAVKGSNASLHVTCCGYLDLPVYRLACVTQLYNLVENECLPAEHSAVRTLLQSIRPAPPQNTKRQQQMFQLIVASPAFAAAADAARKPVSAKWSADAQVLRFCNDYLQCLHPPTSIEQAVCTHIPARISLVSTWLSSVFGAIRFAPWGHQAAAPAAAVASIASSSPPRAVAPEFVRLQFHYDTVVLNCVRRMWNGFGSLTGFMEVMVTWLQPLLKRASIFYGGSCLSVPQRSCFVGMSILLPCVLASVAFPTVPTVVAHIRARRDRTMAISARAWSVVDRRRTIDMVSWLRVARRRDGIARSRRADRG